MIQWRNLAVGHESQVPVRLGLFFLDLDEGALLVLEGQPIQRILRAVGLPTDSPELHPPRYSENLLDHGDDEGTGPFVSLALSSSPSERRLALDLLAAASPHVAWPLLLRMFEQDADPAMMEREADLLERVLPEKGVEKLYDLRLGLDLALEDVEGGPGVELVEQRMDLVARILSKMFVTYRLTEPEVDALEQSF